MHQQAPHMDMIYYSYDFIHERPVDVNHKL